MPEPEEEKIIRYCARDLVRKALDDKTKSNDMILLMHASSSIINILHQAPQPQIPAGRKLSKEISEFLHEITVYLSKMANNQKTGTIFSDLLINAAAEIQTIIEKCGQWRPNPQ